MLSLPLPFPIPATEAAAFQTILEISSILAIASNACLSPATLHIHCAESRFFRRRLKSLSPRSTTRDCSLVMRYIYKWIQDDEFAYSMKILYPNLR